MRTLLRAAQLPALNEAFDDLERQARAQLTAEGVPAAAVAIQRRAAMRTQGQIYELAVPVPEGPIMPAGVQALEGRGHEHKRTYGHRAGAEEPVELVSVQLIASAADAEPPRLPDAARLLGQEAPTPLAMRPAYFGPELGWFDTPVLRRSALAETARGRASLRSMTQPVSYCPGRARRWTSSATSSSISRTLCRAQAPRESGAASRVSSTRADGPWELLVQPTPHETEQPWGMKMTMPMKMSPSGIR